MLNSKCTSKNDSFSRIGIVIVSHSLPQTTNKMPKNRPNYRLFAFDNDMFFFSLIHSNFLFCCCFFLFGCFGCTIKFVSFFSLSVLRFNKGIYIEEIWLWMVTRMRNSNTKSVRNNFHQPITDTHWLHHGFWFNRTADNRAALFAAFFPKLKQKEQTIK